MAAILVVLIQRYAISFPRYDDWDLVPLITKLRQGTLRFSDLFAQQQEARTFFPKLIFLLFGLGKRWDGRALLMFSVLVCCLTSLGIYDLIRKTIFSAKAGCLAFVMIALLIFSPAQHELWLLASGFSSFMPAFYIVCGLVVLGRNYSIATKFILCVVLCFFSSFTVANGLLAWGLTFPLLFLLQWNAEWKRWRWLVAWLAACAACAALYFWGYKPPRELPAFAPPKSLWTYVQYLLAFYGSGLARSGIANPLVIATAVGACLLVGYLGALGWAIRHWRDREFRGRVLPWFALGAYAIASGILAALGRVEYGVTHALESRYVTFSIYLPIALIGFVATAAGERFAARPVPRSRTVLLALLVVTALTLEIWCAASSMALFRTRSAFARIGQAAVLFCPVMDTAEALKWGNHPIANLVRQRSNLLDRFGLLRPPLIRSTVVSTLRFSEIDTTLAAGWFDGVVPNSRPGMVKVTGWAALLRQRRSADCVILTYEREDREAIAFAMSYTIEKREDVARQHRRPDWAWSGWSAIFRADAVPKGAKISAWAFDAKQVKLYRLGGVVNAAGLNPDQVGF